ncbi:MAG: two-component system response regulator [Nitrosopumilaceae archaeon]
MKILQIDDNKDITDVVSKILKLKNHNFTSINDGKKGLKSIQENEYDLIFLDLAMPHYSGYDLLSDLNKDGYSKNNIVIVTAIALSKEEEDKLRNFGITSILQKPININSLLMEIQKHEVLTNEN